MIPVMLAADPRGLAKLKAAAAHDPRSASTQREVARQFESIFAQMMIKSMRNVHLGNDGLGHAGQMYQAMFDQQIAQAMVQGRGLGLAQMLMRQFQGPSAPDSSQLSAVAVVAANAARAAVRPLDSSDRIDSGRARPVDPHPETASAASPAGAVAPQPQTKPVSTADIPTKILDFVERLLPQAQAIAKKLGVSARMIIAQAALETGWGKHSVGGHNLFGIKATGTSPAVTVATTEYIDGRQQRVPQRFHRYASDQAAMGGYAKLISNNPRYRAVVGSGDDAQRFATALQRAGYATDPHYAKKLVAVADSSHLNAALAAVRETMRS